MEMGRSDSGIASVPAARFEGLVMTEAGDEVVVYDTGANHIHKLNTMSAAVWRQCDGQRSVDAVAAAVAAELDVEVSADAVRLALTKLADASLLESPLDESLRQTGQSRRAFLRKAAIAGAVPAIVSISAPLAASAGTGLSCNDCGTVEVEIGSPVECTCPSGTTGVGLCVNVDGVISATGCGGI
jgi:hypothetical protein